MRMPVYYVSNKLVDDITGSGQKRVQISDHTETSKGLGVGIKALLAFFGVDLSLSRTKAHSTVTEIEPSSVDKFLNRLAVIQILPVDEDISLEKESLYSFRTMLSLKRY